MSTKPAPDGQTVVLELVADRRLRATARLVVGGLASRAGFDVEQLASLRSFLDAILELPPAAETVVVRSVATGSGLRLVVGPFEHRTPRVWIGATLTSRTGTRGSR